MEQDRLLKHGRPDCPPVDWYVLWQRGQLPEERIPFLTQHLDSCAACLEALESLVAVDPVNRSLRRQLPTFSAEEMASVESCVQWMAGQAATPLPVEATQEIPRNECYDFLGPPKAADELGRLGSYRILRLLGRGGMGLVFLAEDLQLKRPVALKVIRPDLLQQPGARERFLREARAAAAVRHEHIVTIHQVVSEQDVPFLVMELLEGQSLGTRARTGPPLALSAVVRIGREVAEGLAAAHATGLTHRDIKPDNIWLESPRDKVKLLDFGLARAAAGDERITQSGLIIGTPAYMAPEQVCGDPVDSRTDLFSLGCVLYWLAAERLPYQGKSALAILHALANETPPPLRQLVPSVPESFSRLVSALLQRRPEDRPANAQGVVEALLAIERNEFGAPRESQPAPSPPRVGRLRARLSLRTLAVAGMITFLVAAFAILRLQTAQGEIVVQTSDPNVAVLFEQGKVQIHDRTSGKKYRLSPGAQQLPNGDYELEVTDAAAELTFNARQFVLKRGEAMVLTARFESKPMPVAPSWLDTLKRADIPDEALARAGGGDPTRTPPELVGVLGGVQHFSADLAAAPYLLTRFSPDGRALATVARQTVVVYDTATGRVRQRLEHPHSCSWFAFRPDGQVLAVNCAEGIVLWNLTTGKEETRLTERAELNRFLSFTPDGTALVTTDADGKARLWNVAEKVVVRTFEPPAGHRFTQAPQVHRDGKLVALHASGPKPVVRVVDLGTGATQTDLPGAGSVPGAQGLEYQSTMLFAPSGDWLATAREGEAVKLWEVGSWKPLGELGGLASILRVSSDGRTLFRALVWNGNGAVSVVFDDVKTKRHVRALTLPVAGGLAWSEVSPDGTTVAVRASHGHGVVLCDAVTGKERFPELGHRGLVRSLSISADGRWVTTGGNDQRCLLWDLTPLGRRERLRPEHVKELLFAPQPQHIPLSTGFQADGQTVAALVPHSSWLGVYDTSTGKMLRGLQTSIPGATLRAFAYHPQHPAVTAAAKTRLVQWSLPGGAETTWTEQQPQPIIALAWQADGKQLAAGDQSGGIALWDAVLGKRVRTFQCSAPVRGVAFSPDGKHLAVTAANGRFSIWNLAAGVESRRASLESETAGLAWSPDSRATATASLDGTIRIWEGEHAPRIIRLTAPLQTVAFCPDGRHLLTAGQDGAILVLRLVSKQQ